MTDLNSVVDCMISLGIDDVNAFTNLCTEEVIVQLTVTNFMPKMMLAWKHFPEY